VPIVSAQFRVVADRARRVLRRRLRTSTTTAVAAMTTTNSVVTTPTIAVLSLFLFVSLSSRVVGDAELAISRLLHFSAAADNTFHHLTHICKS